MSGIAGLFHLDGKPLDVTDLQKMMSSMHHRGPDDWGMFTDGSVGLGHTTLWTTPDSLHEKQPLSNESGDVAITADVRIDNRQELIDLLSLGHRDPSRLGDAELILHAYQEWGEACPCRLLGDFAFVIWDRRGRKLFCARDHFGIKPFNYYYAPGRFFAFASETRPILLLTQIPYRINERRIADFLVTQLEGIDKTSTFFEEVYRLPPAHTLTIPGGAVEPRRYWTLEPGPELRLPSDAAYAEAFLEVFTEAVRCRLRGASPVGSMLSGGMDSGSIVAVARELLAQAGDGPLPTFSAVAPTVDSCVETQTIYAALTMKGLEPHIVNHDRLEDLLPELVELTWTLDEPFDNHMTLLRSLYLTARGHGVKAILDGIDGDSVLSEGTHLARLLRRGRWLTAYREAVGEARFWEGAYPAWRELYQNARRAFVPNFIRRLHRALRPGIVQQRLAENIRTSLISPAFARRAGVAQRLETLAAYRPPSLLPNPHQECVDIVDHPYLTVGVERYNRVASAVGVAPRHPFLDRRLVQFCVTLPGEQKLAHGWSKAVLRRAMAVRLPNGVRWRRGKQHLGWAFTSALMGVMSARIQVDLDENRDKLSGYVDMAKLSEACRAYCAGDLTYADTVYEAAHLAVWLRRFARRPQAETVASYSSVSLPHHRAHFFHQNL